MIYNKSYIPKALIISCFCCLSLVSASQEVVASAGEHLQSGNLQINFTLGQLVNGTASPGSVVITQGFHQVFSEVVETLATPDEIVEITVFPNPASQHLTLRSPETSTIYYTLYDLNGAKVASGNFKETTQLDVNSYAKGMYQLLLTNDQEQLLQTFKVQFK